MSRLILAGLASFALAAVAVAQQPAATPAPPPRPVASPDDPIATRQLLFHLSAGTFGGMKMVADAGGDVRPLAFGAQGLVRWARSIPSMFPPGSVGAQSRAKAEIWTNRSDFEAKAAAYQNAATQLAAAARAGDRTAFLAAWDTTRGACGACHELYRAGTP
jgi:cytochrome c556